MGTAAAGMVLLVGQIANGVGTTVVGVLLDRPTTARLCVKVSLVAIFTDFIKFYFLAALRPMSMSL